MRCRTQQCVGLRLNLSRRWNNVGNCRGGSLFAYAGIGMASREFGDSKLAEAAIQSMELDCEAAPDNSIRY